MLGVWWNIIQLFGRPYTIQDTEAIERVQRRFTKNLPGLRKLTYKDRLRHLHLSSLELRRLHVNLVWCYKILFSIVETPTQDFFHAQYVCLH